MSKTRVAIVGCGGMGHWHTRAATQEHGVMVVGACDIAQPALDKYQKVWSVDALYKTWDELYERTSPDIAIICTHAPQHAPATIAAAERGISVFCEKPMAVDLMECDAMVEAADRSGVKLAINHIKRGSRYNQLARRMIEAGDIGELFYVEAFNKGRRTSGIEMMEMGTHISDWVRVFIPDIQWVHAHISADGKEPGVESVRPSTEVNPRDRDCGLVVGHRTFAHFGGSGGVHAAINFWMNTAGDDRGYGLDLVGSKARLALRGSVRTWMYRHDGPHMTPVLGHQWQPVSLAHEDIHDGWPVSDDEMRNQLQRNMLRDLIEAIGEDREPFSSGRDGRSALEMMHGSWASHRAQSRINLPLGDRRHPLEVWKTETGT